MSNIPHNPFTNRSTIENERDFVGREQEITNILSRVRNGDSVSVVGKKYLTQFLLFESALLVFSASHPFADSEGSFAEGRSWAVFLCSCFQRVDNEKPNLNNPGISQKPGF